MEIVINITLVSPVNFCLIGEDNTKTLLDWAISRTASLNMFMMQTTLSVGRKENLFTLNDPYLRLASGGIGLKKTLTIFQSPQSTSTIEYISRCFILISKPGILCDSER